MVVLAMDSSTTLRSLTKASAWMGTRFQSRLNSLISLAEPGSFNPAGANSLEIIDRLGKSSVSARHIISIQRSLVNPVKFRCGVELNIRIYSPTE